jgi:thiamine-monophosphate kinase
MPSAAPQTVRDVGELGLIARLATLVAGPGAAPLVDLGDDAAAWVQGPAVLVASADALVEGVHFDLALSAWGDVGWKALAVNLSDLAAMGAEPAWALVTVGLRPDTPLAGVEELYRAMAELASAAPCRILGGDTVAVRHELLIAVTVLGGVPAGEGDSLLRRDRGRPGDRLAVTGTLGGSAGGLYALRHPGTASPAATATLAATHRRPRPQLAAGRALRRAGVRCAMDVSDGLLADAAKLCAASGVGATIEAARLPLDPEAERAYPDRALAWAAGGGEDYQLLFAAPAAVLQRALGDLAAAGIGAVEIGGLAGPAGEVRLVDPAGHDVPQAERGWDHFAPGMHPSPGQAQRACDRGGGPGERPA